jgi:acetoin utilization deacetylase AcuC-like enzyme
MLLYTHPACLRHSGGPGHPESPQRLAVLLQALQQSDLEMEWHEAPTASREQLLRVHDVSLIDRVLNQEFDDLQPIHRLDPDTAMNADSAEAALRAAGAVCAAVDAVMNLPDHRVFCAVRPPGHHATRVEAMGFCLFNSVAVGAAHALAMHGLQRVAIVDFDVHHGNGTQDIFAHEPRVMYLSSHQDALYPGTGAADETGCGNVLNLPLPEACDSRTFRQRYREIALPALNAFRPQLLLVSAGFDAHRLDPLAGLDLDTADFAWLTAELVAIADAHAGGRLVSTLEGGYSLSALREAGLAHIRALAQA